MDVRQGGHRAGRRYLYRWHEYLLPLMQLYIDLLRAAVWGVPRGWQRDGRKGGPVSHNPHPRSFLHAWINRQASGACTVTDFDNTEVSGGIIWSSTTFSRRPVSKH